eukprot:tig00000402_g244.t1
MKLHRYCGGQRARARRHDSRTLARSAAAPAMASEQLQAAPAGGASERCRLLEVAQGGDLLFHLLSRGLDDLEPAAASAASALVLAAAERLDRAGRLAVALGPLDAWVLARAAGEVAEDDGSENRAALPGPGPFGRLGRALEQRLSAPDRLRHLTRALFSGAEWARREAAEALRLAEPAAPDFLDALDGHDRVRLGRRLRDPFGSLLDADAPGDDFDEGPAARGPAGSFQASELAKLQRIYQGAALDPELRRAAAEQLALALRDPRFSAALRPFLALPAPSGGTPNPQRRARVAPRPRTLRVREASAALAWALFSDNEEAQARGCRTPALFAREVLEGSDAPGPWAGLPLPAPLAAAFRFAFAVRPCALQGPAEGAVPPASPRLARALAAAWHLERVGGLSGALRSAAAAAGEAVVGALTPEERDGTLAMARLHPSSAVCAALDAVAGAAAHADCAAALGRLGALCEADPAAARAFAAATWPDAFRRCPEARAALGEAGPAAAPALLRGACAALEGRDRRAQLAACQLVATLTAEADAAMRRVLDGREAGEAEPQPRPPPSSENAAGGGGGGGGAGSWARGSRAARAALRGVAGRAGEGGSGSPAAPLPRRHRRGAGERARGLAHGHAGGARVGPAGRAHRGGRGGARSGLVAGPRRGRRAELVLSLALLKNLAAGSGEAKAALLALRVAALLERLWPLAAREGEALQVELLGLLAGRARLGVAAHGAAFAALASMALVPEFRAALARTAFLADCAAALDRVARERAPRVAAAAGPGAPLEELLASSVAAGGGEGVPAAAARQAAVLHFLGNLAFSQMRASLPSSAPRVPRPRPRPRPASFAPRASLKAYPPGLVAHAVELLEERRGAPAALRLALRAGAALLLRNLAFLQEAKPHILAPGHCWRWCGAAARASAPLAAGALWALVYNNQKALPGPTPPPRLRSESPSGALPVSSAQRPASAALREEEEGAEGAGGAGRALLREARRRRRGGGAGAEEEEAGISRRGTMQDASPLPSSPVWAPRSPPRSGTTPARLSDPHPFNSLLKLKCSCSVRPAVA